MTADFVRIFDTTLRDGEQAPGFSMNMREKLKMAHQLEKLRVDVIEAGFPVASADDFAAVEAISNEIETVEICALCRALPTDIETAWKAVSKAKKPRLHTFIATSPIHMQTKLKKTPEEVLKQAFKSVKLAKSLCDRVDFSPEDAGRSDREFLVEIVGAAIEAGADIINIPDTVGYNQPEEFGSLIAYLIKNTPGADKVIFSTHCHDDLGLAAANSLAGVKAGARQIEGTISGIGERAGNASIEEVAMNFEIRQDYWGIKTNLNLAELYPAAHLLQKITGKRIPANKAIIGRNAFAHESGIHQDGVLKNTKTYEIMTPEMVGRVRNHIVLGKHSGRAALGEHLSKLGFTLSPEQMNLVFAKFKTLADTKKVIESTDLLSLAGESLGSEKPSRWELVKYNAQTKTEDDKNTSAVHVEIQNTMTNAVLVGDGSGRGFVEAAFAALETMLPPMGTLIEYQVDSVTKGIDDQAVVRVTFLGNDEQVFCGTGQNEDIVRASIISYLEACNMFILSGNKTQG